MMSLTAIFCPPVVFTISCVGSGVVPVYANARYDRLSSVSAVVVGACGIVPRLAFVDSSLIVVAVTVFTSVCIALCITAPISSCLFA